MQNVDGEGTYTRFCSDLGIPRGMGRSVKGVLACYQVCQWMGDIHGSTAQDSHESSLWQLAESVGKDHIKQMYSDPKDWHNYSIQEHNIKRLFSSTVDRALQIEKGIYCP